MTCPGIPLRKASDAPPILGECSPYKLGSRSANCNKVLKAYRAAGYETGFPDTIAYSDSNGSHFHGGNR